MPAPTSPVSSVFDPNPLAIRALTSISPEQKPSACIRLQQQSEQDKIDRKGLLPEVLSTKCQLRARFDFGSLHLCPSAYTTWPLDRMHTRTERCSAGPLANVHARTTIITTRPTLTLPAFLYARLTGDPFATVLMRSG